jgi:hypothetical protein
MSLYRPSLQTEVAQSSIVPVDSLGLLLLVVRASGDVVEHPAATATATMAVSQRTIFICRTTSARPPKRLQRPAVRKREGPRRKNHQ